MRALVIACVLVGSIASAGARSPKPPPAPRVPSPPVAGCDEATQKWAKPIRKHRLPTVVCSSVRYLEGKINGKRVLLITGASPQGPVLALLVNGKLVARGEVVVVGGNYGVRVHEVVSAAERIRTLE